MNQPLKIIEEFEDPCDRIDEFLTACATHPKEVKGYLEQTTEDADDKQEI